MNEGFRAMGSGGSLQLACFPVFEFSKFRNAAMTTNQRRVSWENWVSQVAMLLVDVHGHEDSGSPTFAIDICSGSGEV